MEDIDNLVKGLNELLGNLLSVSNQKNPYGNNKVSFSLINISFNVTSCPLDETILHVTQEKLYKSNEVKDPLVDVIEIKDQIRVIVTLPGIKSENVWFDVRPGGILTIEIMASGQILKKEIQCKAKPEQISIKSSKVNNSVLELVFDKI